MGDYNTATGSRALVNNVTGKRNTANGARALVNNTTGDDNTATGYQALASNGTGAANTAAGVQALKENTSGTSNTATGSQALSNNLTGNNNTADGARALLNNATGNSNTAAGFQALASNGSGGANTAAGANSLRDNATASNNTGMGVNALLHNTTGVNNVGFGINTLKANTTGNSNTAIGNNCLVINTGNFNIALGEDAGTLLTTGNNNIDIGYKVSGAAGESSTIRIGDPFVQGATYIAGISGAAVPNGASVIVDTSGHLGTIMSSQRFKDDIKPMDKTSEAILALKPVTFHYKKELDPQRIQQFGLVAEQVEKVDPDLVARDVKGQTYTVRYEAVNAMSLNEFLKEHNKVNKLESTVAQQQKEIEALTAGLQKVSAQLDVNKPAPQVAENNQ